MTEAPTQSSVTSHTITVEHIRISSGLPFAEVRRKLEATVPKLDPGIAKALRSGDQERAKDYEQNGPKLSIFGEHDHGALLKIAGSGRNALQYKYLNTTSCRASLARVGILTPPCKLSCSMLPSSGPNRGNLRLHGPPTAPVLLHSMNRAVALTGGRLRSTSQPLS
jgi:hypothetical protein